MGDPFDPTRIRGGALSEELDSTTAGPDDRVEPLAAVDEALFAALDDEPGADIRSAATRAAGALLASFEAAGDGAAAEQARMLAGALADDAPLHPRAMELARAAASLRTTGGGFDPGPGRREATTRPEVVALVTDDGLRERLAAAAAARGIAVALHADEHGAREALAAPVAPPVLLVAPAAGARLAGLAVAYDALASGVPVAVAGGRVAEEPPDAILRLPAGLDAGALLDATRTLAVRGRADGARITVASPDAALASTLRDALEPVGATVTADPGSALPEGLGAATPDALVVDGREGRLADALGLVRAIRLQPDLGGIATLLLADAADDLAVAYAAGIDDVLTGLPRAELLAACLMNRLARIGVLRRAGDADPLTGLPRQGETLRAVERLRARSARDGAPFALAFVGLDDLLRTNAEHGRAAGDAVVEAVARLLGTAVREGDVVGRWTGAEFVVGGHGLAGRTAVARLERVVADAVELQPAGAPTGTRCRLSAGIAIHPAGGTSVAALVESAEAALAQARRGGGGRVVLAESAPPRTAETTDVLVVEDDRFTRELVVQTLRGQGLRVEAQDDGSAAAERLTDARRIPPRVVLLDWELPGIDGPAVLRRMADAGTLRDTRVIMLTGRSTEQDILAVMRAGAADHVPKPFSVPVLVERVRRALLS